VFEVTTGMRESLVRDGGCTSSLGSPASAHGSLAALQHASEFVVPERLVLPCPEHDGSTLFKPAVRRSVDDADVGSMGIKVGHLMHAICDKSKCISTKMDRCFFYTRIPGPNELRHTTRS
jgi:hypothetical protein